MGRCLALLLFGLVAVFIASIQCAELPDLNWYYAKTDFQYSKENKDGKGEPLQQYSDNILMVGIDKLGKIVGSASSYCRYISPPNEQVIFLEKNGKKTSEYTFLKADGIQELPVGDYISPPHNHGCLTGVNNYLSIKPKEPLPGDKTAKLSATYKPAVGTSLIAVYLNKDQQPVAQDVRVKDFSECQKVFDPNNLYLVDKDEQLCTERVNSAIVGDPMALNSALLFEKSGDEYKLVGIETKAFGGVSLSSWPGYQCKEFEKGNCDV